jgi:uncharacterized protein YneF (UPF0154 family)
MKFRIILWSILALFTGIAVGYYIGYNYGYDQGVGYFVVPQ